MNRSRWLQAVFLFVRFGRLDQKELFRDSFEFMEYTWPMCHHISVTIFFASFWSFITYLSFTIGVLCKSKFGFFLFCFWAGKDYALPTCGWQANKYFPRKDDNVWSIFCIQKNELQNYTKEIFPKREDKALEYRASQKQVTNRIGEFAWFSRLAKPGFCCQNRRMRGKIMENMQR